MAFVIDEDDYGALVKLYWQRKYRNIRGRASPGTTSPTTDLTRTELELAVKHRRSTN